MLGAACLSLADAWHRLSLVALKDFLCIKAVSGGVKVGVVPRCKADRSPPESVQLISRRSNKTSFSFITVTKCRCKSIKMYSSNSIFFSPAHSGLLFKEIRSH